MIEVVNRQRKIKVKLEGWDEFVLSAIDKIPEAVGKSMAIAFVSDRKMREFNRVYRGKNNTTDVLSFPAATDDFDGQENYLGDIAISLEQAKTQAEENRLSLETELKQLILHGILHLCGYDHETDAGKMNALELELRDKLSVN